MLVGSSDIARLKPETGEVEGVSLGFKRSGRA